MSQPTNPSNPLRQTSPTCGRSHLAAGVKLTGDINASGLIELLGHVDGKITADSLVIDEVGSAVGEIRANSVVITGRFEGIIEGGDVRLHFGSKVSGKIFYTTLSIENGAEVNASCSRRARDGNTTGGSDR